MITRFSPIGLFRHSNAILILLLIGLGLLSLSQARAIGDGSKGISLPPVPVTLFGPSNAKTESGQSIPTGQFFPASRCAGCHRDTHTAWAASLHRNAGREPFY